MIEYDINGTILNNPLQRNSTQELIEIYNERPDRRDKRRVDHEYSDTEINERPTKRSRTVNKKSSTKKTGGKKYNSDKRKKKRYTFKKRKSKKYTFKKRKSKV